MVIFLQNAISASFFDIYIYDVNITRIAKITNPNNLNRETISMVDFITFTLKCCVIPPSEKTEIHW